MGIPLAAKGHNYSISLTIRGFDGVQSRTLQSYTARFTLAANTPNINGTPASQYILNSDGSVLPQVVENGQVIICLRPMPSVGSTIVTVDPAAEKRLLGKNGTFLDGLISYDNLERNGSPINCLSVGCGAGSATLSSQDLAVFKKLTRPIKDDASSALRGIYATPSDVFLPYLRNANAYPPLTLTASFSDNSTNNWLGSTDVDLTQRLQPFAGSNLNVAWPGMNTPTFATAAQTNIATGLFPLASNLKAGPQGLLKVSLDSAGLIDSTGQKSANLGSAANGATQTYRTPADSIVLKIASAELPGAAPLEVGSFSSNALRSDASASGVPLGGYDPVSVSITQNGQSQKLRPSISGLGVTASPAAAIMSIKDVRALGLRDPIDLVRVRVSPSTTSTAFQEKIRTTAKQLSEEGFRVLIVDGSSLEDVPTSLPRFVTEQAGVLSLSTVEGSRPYLRLGAATLVDTSLEFLTSLGVLLAAIAATGLLAVSSTASVATRRAESLTLAISGLTRGSRFRWFISEDLAALLVFVLIIGSAAIVAGRIGSPSTPVVIGGSAVIAAIVIAVITAFSGSAQVAPTSPRQRRSTAIRVNSTSYAIAELRQHPGEVVTWVACSAVAIVSTTLLVALIPTLLHQATQVRLGAYAVQVSAVPLALSIGLAAVCTAIAQLIVSRQWRARRREQERLLREECGWTSRMCATSNVFRTFILWTASSLLAVGAVELASLSRLSIHPNIFVAGVVGAILALTSIAASVRSADRKPSRSSRNAANIGGGRA
jgi:hypothetical protein